MEHDRIEVNAGFSPGLPGRVGPAASLDLVATAAPLPSPHGVALELMRVMQRDDVTVTHIANVLRADPAMSGRLISAANVAALSGRRPVVAVADAVTTLGMTAVRGLVLGFSLVSDYGRGNCVKFDYQGFWSRSLLVALAAQSVARKVRIASSEEMFACGLLSQVGALAFATLYPDSYSELLTAASAQSDEYLRTLERERYGMDNVEMSAMMLRDWGLPDVLVGAVAALAGEAAGSAAALPLPLPSAVAPGEARAEAIRKVLRFSVDVAGLCFADATGRRQLLPQLLAASARLGIDAQSLSALAAEIITQWGVWGLLLRVTTGDGGDMARDLRDGGAAAQMNGTDDAPESALRVLLVGRDGPVQAALRTAIEAAGHIVMAAGDDGEALALAVRFCPQVLIAELEAQAQAQAGGRDGRALCRALRETTIGKNLYVMMLIAGEDEALIEAAFAAGADDYLVRPVFTQVLNARLRAARRLISQQEQMVADIHTIRTLATALATNNRRLEPAAATDPLTALPNRRYMMERLVQSWAAAQRRVAPLSCIAIDIDHFKRVNDTLGHAAGDAALRHVAALLRSNARLQDLVCRTGGEEFLVICPDISLEEARQCAERLRVAVAGAPFHHAAGASPITISAGVACVTAQTAGVEALLQEADRALYHAKAAGRDRVAVA